MKTLYPSEASLQATFFEWLELSAKKYPLLELFYAIPNEGNRSAFNGWKRKLTGRKAGIPDTHLPIPSGDYNGLWLEFKSRRGVVSENQKQWHERLRNAGHRVEICRTVEDAIAITSEYLKMNGTGRNSKTNS